MPKVKISEYSTTNSSNTDINSINIDEGCAPSGINNAIREVMVHLKNWQTNASGDGATFASLVIQGTGSFTGAVTMSAGATLSGTNTLSGSNIISGNINSSGSNTFSGSQVISGNINSSGTTNTFSGGNILSGTNTISGSAIISGNINSSGSSNTFSGGVVHSGTNTFSSSVIISGNINSSGSSNTFSGNNVFSGTNTFSSSVIISGSISTTGAATFTDPEIIGTVKEDVFTITDGAAFEIDPGNGSIQLITLGASRTPKATNFAAGESVTLMVDDGTAYTLTWTDTTFGTSGVIWETNAGVAPTLATSGYTVIVLWKVGTQVYGARVGDA